jgi:hypothetical protein
MWGTFYDNFKMWGTFHDIRDLRQSVSDRYTDIDCKKSRTNAILNSMVLYFLNWFVVFVINWLPCLD